MEIVIDIPESSLGLINDETTKIVYEAIRNGTVLPEGHGDLIDRSKLDTRERGNNSQRCMWWNIKQIIDNAPVIIEGDKE